MAFHSKYVHKALNSVNYSVVFHFIVIWVYKHGTMLLSNTVFCLGFFFVFVYPKSFTCFF